jgi:hypothetical protein
VARNGGLVHVHPMAVRYCTAVVDAVTTKARDAVMQAAATGWVIRRRSFGRGPRSERVVSPREPVSEEGQVEWRKPEVGAIAVRDEGGFDQEVGVIDYFAGSAATRAFANRAATSAQSVRHAARSGSGRASTALSSRMPVRSVSSCQCFRAWAMDAFAWGGLDSSSFAQTASSALSQPRACPRSLALAASSRTGLSLPWQHPASAAEQAAL